MIFGKLEDLHLYKNLSPNMAKGIEFVLNFTPEMADGRYEIDGKNVYALVSTSETKLPSEPVYEAHRRYIDLQYVVSGEEDTGYAAVSDCEVDTPYDEEGDYLMVRGAGSEVKVSASHFYIAYPCDGHAPMLSKNPGKIRKVIVKILV